MKILNLLYEMRFVISAFSLAAYALYPVLGWWGVAIAAVTMIAIEIGMTWYMAWRYYRHNKYRTIPQAMLYLMGISNRTKGD